MKILVTGASGQLGKELSNVLEVSMPGITTYVDRQQLDLTDRVAVDRIVGEGQFTHIINCAAFTDVNGAEANPRECRAVNAEAVGVLATAANRNDSKIIHISTDYVFDGKTNRPYRESDKVNPLSEYGRSKRQGEMLLLDMASEGLIIRTSWLYSPYGKNFVKTMKSNALEGRTSKVVIDQIGSPTSAYDLAKAISRILVSPRWIGGIFNFSNQGICSWYDLAVEVYRYYGKDASKVLPITSENIPMTAQRPLYSVLDKSLISGSYGINIPHWRESLENCLNRMNENNIKEKENK